MVKLFVSFLVSPGEDMVAKRQEPFDRNSTTSSESNLSRKTRSQYAKAKDSLNDSNEKKKRIEEQESELDRRQKVLDAEKKKYEDDVKMKQDALHDLRAEQKLVREQFNHAKTAIFELLLVFGPGKPDFSPSSFKSWCTDLNGYKHQLEDFGRTIPEAEKRLSDSAELEKLRSEQEQETEALLVSGE